MAEKSLILSVQGKATLRNLINTSAVSEGYIYPHEKDNDKWRLTNKGKEVVEQQTNQQEDVLNTETGEVEIEIPNAVKGEMLEKYILGLLKEMHPYYSWYHQGKHKNNERGLDLIANKIGEKLSEYKTIGVQIKIIKKHLHQQKMNG